MRHYRPAFIEGTTNIHALTLYIIMRRYMHKRAMHVEAKEAASSLMECAPITKAMAQANLSETARLKNKRKMDIVYTITKKNLN